MPFAPNAPIDLALKERIRLAYYDEGRPVAAVEEVAGVGRSTLYRWFHAWGWPLRKPMRSRVGGRKDPPAFSKAGGSAAGRPAFAAGAPEAGTPGWRPAAREPLKLRLQRLVEHRIALLEHEAMTGVAVDPEANARAIEINARTLVTIQRLGGEPEPCPECSGDGPQRSLPQLRDELRDHLRRLRKEARAQRGLSEEDDDYDDVLPTEGAAPSGDAPGEPSHA